MTDFSTHYARTLAHYLKLYETPGWKQYVEQKVAELARLEPGLYGDLPGHFRPQAKLSAARRSGGR